MPLSKYRGEIILVVVTLLAACGWFFSKYAISDFPPVGFMGIRFMVAPCLFLPFAWQELRKMTREQYKGACLTGLLSGLYLYTWVSGIANSTNLGQGAFIMSLSMLVAPIISWAIYQHKPVSSFWISLPIAMAGLYFLALGKESIEFTEDTLFFSATAVLSAFYFVLANQYAKSIPVLPLTMIQLFGVGIVCGTYSLLMENWNIVVQPAAWGWLGASILISTNLRFLLQTIGQKHCHITNAALIMILEPVWTLILSILLLGEKLTWTKSLGCLFILGALLAYRLPSLFKKHI